MHPYHRFVSETARLVREARHFPLGGLPFAARPALAADAPRVLIFSPHPDDECIVGALALRLLRQAKMRVVDVAVTQGSNKERQAGRLAELRGACAFLGFEVLTTAPGGLDRINAATRAADHDHWRAAVAVIAEILARERPRVVFCPHGADSNSTHIGTHLLVMDALARQPLDFACHLVLTEYWAALATPNLMVESSVDDVADLVAATAFHAGEVRRNPYHLGMPAWMQDNVRRGGELVGGQGSAAPDFAFATLYRLERWRQGAREPVLAAGRLLSVRDDPWALLLEAAP
jgi:LmbE family N-acetylglucosaminyl deacetylase